MATNKAAVSESRSTVNPVTKLSPTLKNTITIKPPRLEVLELTIRGTSPLVVHRMSAKLKAELAAKADGSVPKGARAAREPRDVAALYLGARYISPEGWDGFHAGALRHAAISACRLANFKMTIAKLSIFFIEDGRDALEPQVPLIRIYGNPTMQEDLARVETGQPYVTVRAAYYEWYSRLRILFDANQFRGDDMANLIDIVGRQVGICEGRYDSKNSPGLGWGCFAIVTN